MFLYCRASRIVTITLAFRDALMRREINGTKIDVVANGLNLRHFAP
jgi:hypothetical protein